MCRSRMLAFLLACHGLTACELIADFDRGKLDAGRPVDSGSTPVVPSEPKDAAADAAVDDDAGPQLDTDTDAGA